LWAYVGLRLGNSYDREPQADVNAAQ